MYFANDRKRVEFVIIIQILKSNVLLLVIHPCKKNAICSFQFKCGKNNFIFFGMIYTV